MRHVVTDFDFRFDFLEAHSGEGSGDTVFACLSDHSTAEHFTVEDFLVLRLAGESHSNRNAVDGGVPDVIAQDVTGVSNGELLRSSSRGNRHIRGLDVFHVTDFAVSSIGGRGFGLHANALRRTITIRGQGQSEFIVFLVTFIFVVEAFVFIVLVFVFIVLVFIVLVFVEAFVVEVFILVFVVFVVGRSSFFDVRFQQTASAGRAEHRHFVGADNVRSCTVRGSTDEVVGFYLVSRAGNGLEHFRRLLLNDGRSVAGVGVVFGSACHSNQSISRLNHSRFGFAAQHVAVVGNRFFQSSTGSNGALTGNAVFAFAVFTTLLGSMSSDGFCVQVGNSTCASRTVLQQRSIIGNDVSVAASQAYGVVGVDQLTTVRRQELHLFHEAVTFNKIIRASQRVEHVDVGVRGRENDEGVVFIVQSLDVLASGNCGIEVLSFGQRVRCDNNTAKLGTVGHRFLLGSMRGEESTPHDSIATHLLRLRIN